MKWIILTVLFYMLSYAFGAVAFPQIIGSVREIKKGNKGPYTFALLLWSAIFACVTWLVYTYMKQYFATYLIALALPLLFTLRTDHIE